MNVSIDNSWMLSSPQKLYQYFSYRMFRKPPLLTDQPIPFFVRQTSMNAFIYEQPWHIPAPWPPCPSALWSFLRLDERIEPCLSREEREWPQQSQWFTFQYPFFSINYSLYFACSFTLSVQKENIRNGDTYLLDERLRVLLLKAGDASVKIGEETMCWGGGVLEHGKELEWNNTFTVCTSIFLFFLEITLSSSFFFLTHPKH